MRIFLCRLLLAAADAAQQPDVAAQRTAMKKLTFLAGKWSGDASVARAKRTFEADAGRGCSVQSGRAAAADGRCQPQCEGRIVFRALGTVSFDDATGEYHIRAYNDGRYLDTPLTVTPNGFEWGYTAGPVLRQNCIA